MENERKKKFQDYAPPEQKPSGGYNLNGVYYSRDGQRLDDQPKKSWSQREYERAEREKIHCRAKREQGESEVDAQGNPLRSCLMEKLVILCAIKYATLDAYAMGIEMEGGKPGWYDALNGMPGLFGSSMAETYELARMLSYTIEALKQYPGEVALIEELLSLIHI